MDGLNSAQACNCYPPDQAIATDLSYVMEGVNNAVGIYRTSTGALAFGPYPASYFFSSVMLNGDDFSDPQMYYDVMRDRWIVAWLEITPGATATGASHDYIDIAVSTSNSPTQPTPSAQYNIYRIDANFFNGGSGTGFCDYPTLGVEYYSVTISCVMFRAEDGVFLGNSVVTLPKAPMLTGANFTYYHFDNAVNTSVNTCGAGSSPCPAFRLSPAIEEGVQDGEFIVATNSGYGGPTSNLTVCALTNLSNIATPTAPTMSCMLNNLGTSYTDSVGARQPGTATTIDPGDGIKQVYYKAGRLFLAWTTAIAGPRDGVIWAEVQPLLSTKAAHNPQQINGMVVTQGGILALADTTTDLYMPTLMGTDEDDVTLVMNYSSAGGGASGNVFPSIIYTGRKASDAPGTMGQGATFNVVSGTHTNLSGRWGDYSACAIPLNSVTRGTIWCAGEYAGNQADPGWNTRLYSLRAE